MRESVKIRKPIIIIFICVFLVMLVFNFLTPYLLDDYTYIYSFATGEKITRVTDIFPSMLAHRSLMNGRVVAHFFVQLFLMMPKWIFNIVNSLFTVSILYLMFKLSIDDGFEDKKKSIFVVLCGLFMLWIFTPYFGQDYLWLDGACNYSWGMAFSLAYLYPFYRSYMNPEKRFPVYIWILFMPLSLITGCYSESASLAALFIAVCLFAAGIRNTRKINVKLLAGLILALIGYAYLMSAPVEVGSKGVFSLTKIINQFYGVIWSIKNYFIVLYCIFIVLLSLCIFNKCSKKKIFFSIVLFLGGLGSVLAFSFANYFPGRVLCTLTTYTALACMVLISELLKNSDAKPIKAFICALAMVFAVEFLFGATDIMQVYIGSRARNEIVAQAQADGVKDLELEPLYSQTKYSGLSGQVDIQESDFWVNVHMARHFGFDSITNK